MAVDGIEENNLYVMSRIPEPRQMIKSKFGLNNSSSILCLCSLIIPGGHHFSRTSTAADFPEIVRQDSSRVIPGKASQK